MQRITEATKTLCLYKIFVSQESTPFFSSHWTRAFAIVLIPSKISLVFFIMHDGESINAVFSPSFGIISIVYEYGILSLLYAQSVLLPEFGSKKRNFFYKLFFPQKFHSNIQSLNLFFWRIRHHLNLVIVNTTIQACEILFERTYPHCQIENYCHKIVRKLFFIPFGKREWY